MHALKFIAAVLVAACLGTAVAQSSSQLQPAVADKPGGRTFTQGTQQLVLLDTDIGDDIDDAFALALLLESPEVKMLGITTAYGDTDLRANLVDRYLCATGKGAGVPVIPGVPTPHSNVFSQAAYASHVPSGCAASRRSKDAADAARVKGERQRHDAAGFLLRQIKAHPGQITLIAIGPLFNLQAAIERDPATFRKVKRVVLMGGSVYRGYGLDAGGKPKPPEPEWNIDRDPSGAKALLAVGVPVFMMPLDSTQIPLDEPNRERIYSAGSPLGDQLTLLYHQWMTGSHSKTPTLFDPVAAAYALRPELCPAQPLHLDIDEKGGTIPTPGPPNANVCLKSDEPAFLAFLLSRIAPTGR